MVRETDPDRRPPQGRARRHRHIPRGRGEAAIVDRPRRRFDVAVVGGGPGGGATALTLRAHEPRLSVVLLEASRYDAPRIGETLPPTSQALLENLGVWEAFLASEPGASHGTSSAWGGAGFRDNPFVLSARGPGWHIDRTRFDSLLAEQARRRGADLRLRSRVAGAERGPSGWRLRLAGGGEIEARFLVDASGRGAWLARRLGARVRAEDRLVGFARFFTVPEPGESVTLVEPFSEGWWYTAPLPDRRRVVALMTDADIARRLRAGSPEGWQERLDDTARVGPAVAGGAPAAPLLARSAASQRLEPVAGDDWIAVGDAASTIDPLSSQGMLKALRSGIFAAYAVADRLVHGESAGLERYEGYVARELAAHRRARARYYSEETRWPESIFWNRRREPYSSPARTTASRARPKSSAASSASGRSAPTGSGARP